MTRPARRNLIEDALVRHGLDSAVARRVRLIGQALREETLRHRREYATLIDAQTGARLGATIEGQADEVDAARLFRQLAPGTAYVGLHTHPHSLPFSVTDVAVLLAQPSLRLVIAVGRDGSWDLISVEPGATPGDIAALRDTFARIAEATATGYQAPPYPGEREARRAHMYHVWQQAAPALGLRYDRIEGRART